MRGDLLEAALFQTTLSSQTTRNHLFLPLSVSSCLVKPRELFSSFRSLTLGWLGLTQIDAGLIQTND